jgi:hypothetical protein
MNLTPSVTTFDHEHDLSTDGASHLYQVIVTNDYTNKSSAQVFTGSPYTIVDATTPTGTLGTPVITNKTMSITISELSEACSATLYRGLTGTGTLLDSSLNSSTDHTLTFTEIDYGNYSILLFYMIILYY